MARQGLWKLENVAQDPSKSAFDESGFRSATQSNHEVDAVDLHARRRLRQTLKFHVPEADIHQRAAVEVVEMVVRICVRIEPAAVVAHGELADQARGREQIERVVD